MTKTFCDKCSKLIEEKQSIDHYIDLTMAEKQVRIVATTAGDFCLHCLIDAINTLDDRPKHISGCALLEENGYKRGREIGIKECIEEVKELDRCINLGEISDRICKRLSTLLPK